MNDESPNSLYVEGLLAKASSLATGSVDLAWVDARPARGLFRELQAQSPLQLELFDKAASYDPADCRTQVETAPAFARLLSTLRELLRSTGHIFVLCDPASSHQVKSLIEEVFGSARFAREFVLSAGDKASQPASHEQIIVYSKSEEGNLNRVFEDVQAAGSQTLYRYLELETGRRYALGDCVHPNPNRRDLSYEWNGVLRVWRWNRVTMSDLHSSGRLIYSKTGLPRLKRYLDERSRREIGSVWDMGFSRTPQLNSLTVARIIELGSTSGATVLDAYCISSDLLIAATKGHRSWIGLSPTHRHAARVRNDLRNGLGPTADDLYVFHGPRSREAAIALMHDSPSEFKSWALGAVGAVFAEGIRHIEAGMDGRLWVEEAPIPVIVRTSEIREQDVRGCIRWLRREKHRALVVVAPSVPRQAAMRALSTAQNIVVIHAGQLVDLDRIRLRLQLRNLLASKPSGARVSHRSRPRSA